MANVKDAEVLIVGTALSVEEVTARDTGEYRGRKITLLTDEGGIAIVKITPQDRVDIPQRGQLVAWMIRNTPWEVEGNSGMSTRFVRAFSKVDEDAIARALASAAPAKS